MDKLLMDMDALCQTTAKEREERYCASCRMARISEIMLSGNEIVCGGGAGVRVLIETEWREQQLMDGEMAMIKSRDDQVDRLSGKHQDHMMFIINEGDVPADSILSPDRGNEDPHYGKTCEETLRDVVDELQGMADLLEYMNMIEDCDIDDMLDQLNASISVYNEGI